MLNFFPGVLLFLLLGACTVQQAAVIDLGIKKAILYFPYPGTGV
jgi:hypothetical protein